MKGRIEKLPVYRKHAHPPFEVFAPDGMTFELGVHSRIAWDKAEAQELSKGPFMPCPIAECDVCEEDRGEVES